MSVEQVLAESIGIPIDDPFSRRLRALMKGRGMRGAELARRTGLKHSTISAWLTGKGGSPRLSMIRRLARGLEVSASALVAE